MRAVGITTLPSCPAPPTRCAHHRLAQPPQNWPHLGIKLDRLQVAFLSSSEPQLHFHPDSPSDSDPRTDDLNLLPSSQALESGVSLRRLGRMAGSSHPPAAATHPQPPGGTLSMGPAPTPSPIPPARAGLASWVPAVAAGGLSVALQMTEPPSQQPAIAASAPLQRPWTYEPARDPGHLP